LRMHFSCFVRTVMSPSGSVGIIAEESTGAKSPSGSVGIIAEESTGAKSPSEPAGSEQW